MSSLETRQAYLESGGYRTGRTIRENGEVVNLADVFGNATDISGGLITINLEHSKIHQGEGWEASIESGNITSLSDFYVLLKVSAGERPHLRSYGVTVTEGPVYIRLYESPTTSANGTAVTSRNRNRSTSDVNGVSVFTGPTVSNDGTRLETDLIPAAGNKVGGNAASFYEEWILKAETDYLLKVSNGSNNTIQSVINMFWYT